MSKLPIYKKWDDIPSGIATKTTLYRDYGLKLADGQQPVARKRRYNHRGKHVGYYDLYDMTEAVPKKKPTEAQLKALEKARYMAESIHVSCSKCGRYQFNRYGSPITVTRKRYLQENYQDHVCKFCDDKARAVRWAKHMLSMPNDVVILDTETTDLHGEIIEIAVIDTSGNVILDQRIKPVDEIAPGAKAVHGISEEDLQDCPSFPDVYPKIKAAIEQKIVVMYNAAFDRGRLLADCERHDLERIKFGYDCAMQWYAQWYGEWSNYFGSYKWQPLNGGHSALSDCRATLEVVKTIATGGADD